MKKSFIISFEGIDGCGKTTIAKKFYDYLKKNNFSVVFLHEPGGTEIGEKIRKILLEGKENIDKYCELLLYMASRIQLINEKIKKYAKKHKIIILDRYIDSTYAYQGYGRKIPIKKVQMLQNLLIEKNFIPDLTILIDEKPENLREILEKKIKDRIENESIEFQRRVREGYLKIAKKFKRIKVVQRKSLEETFKDVIRIWEEFINENRRD